MSIMYIFLRYIFNFVYNKYMCKFKHCFNLVITFFTFISFSSATTFKELDIQVNNVTLHVEVASTHEKRLLGLMHRKKLLKNKGMLFIYPSERIIKLWMKNTQIPLSVAFLNKNKKIINIEKMEPNQTKVIYKSKDLALYAVEVNQGWFKTNKISVGDNFKF